MITPLNKMRDALKVLDACRREIEDIDQHDCGDEEIDNAVFNALNELEARIAQFYAFGKECVTDRLERGT